MTLPTKEELDSIDMMPIYNKFWPVPEREYLLAPAGVEHYRLLKWISDNVEFANMPMRNQILEIGTYMGFSAGCFASNEKRFIYSVDISFDFYHNLLPRPNISLHKYESTVDQPVPDYLMLAPLVFVDTWHEGLIEKSIFDMCMGLTESTPWRGILIYDDIYYNDAMKEFWTSVKHPGKIDATHIGHHTGTGIIDFSI
jgi:hypothetical protein